MSFTVVDFILLVVGLVIFFLSLAGALAGFFVLQGIDEQRAIADFKDKAAKETIVVSNNINAITTNVNTIQTLLQIYGSVNFYDVYKPFVASLSSSSLNGSEIKLPSWVAFYENLDYVPGANASQYVDQHRAWGGVYSNFNNIIPFNLNNSRVPDVYRDYYWVCNQYLPDNEAVIGTNLGAEPTRNQTLLEVYQSGIPASTAKLTFSKAVGGGVGVTIYAPVIRNNKTISIQAAAFRIHELLRQVTSLNAGEGIALYDANDTMNYMSVVTSGYPGLEGRNDVDLKDYEVKSMINGAALHESDNYLVFYNRHWNVVFFSYNKSVSYIKIIPLCVILFIMLLAEITLLVMFAYRKISSAKKIQELTKSRVEILEVHRSKLNTLLKQSIRSETKARSIINSLSDLVVVISGRGRIIQCNNSFEKVFSFSNEEFEAGVLIKNIFVNLRDNFYESVGPNDVITTEAKLSDRSMIIVEIKVSNMVNDEMNPQTPIATPVATPNLDASTSFQMTKDEDEESYVLLMRKI
ncbi:hypothetical protein AKO1_012277 [Acrasis kona]|uniref:PAS domain-containing protein n=1 Tax=Acrasis kona TaxID=1008807 RepID=A0AAW2ZAN9_9EUKA